MARRSIETPTTKHVFERLAILPDVAPTELPVVFVGPHFQVHEAFDTAGQPLTAAQVGSYSWSEQGSLAVFGQQGRGDQYVQYDVPNLMAGAILQDLDLWGKIASNTSPVQLRDSAGESVLAQSSAATGTLTPAGTLNGFDFVLTDTTINFYRLLRAPTIPVVYPTTDAQLSEGGWVMVRLSGHFAGPFYVAEAPSVLNPYRVVLKSLSYCPLYASATVGFSLVQNPAEYTTVQGPLSAHALAACFTRAETVAFTHLKLVQPGTFTVEAGGGLAAALILTFAAPGSLTNDQIFTLNNSAAVPVIFGIDTDASGVIGADVVIDVSGLVTAAAVVAAVVTAINADGRFRARAHPTYGERVIVRQTTSGVAGNRTVTCSAGFDFFVNAPTPSPLISTFTGGAAAGTTYTFKNVSDLPVRIHFNTAAGVEDTAHPGWEVNVDDEYQTIGAAGFTLATTGGQTSAWELNRLLSTDGWGGPRVFVEPASVENWSDAANTGLVPTRSLSALLATDGADLAAFDFTDGAEPVGEILVPAAQVRQFPVYHALVEVFPTTASFSVVFASSDREALAVAHLGDGVFEVTLPNDAGSVYAGRDVGSSATPLHEQVISALNTALHTYITDTLEIAHCPSDVLRLYIAPEDTAFYHDDATDWYAMPTLAGVGVDAGGPSLAPSFYALSGANRVASNLEGAGRAITHVAKFAYRTEGVGGNSLTVSFASRPNAGEATDLALVLEQDELLIYLPTLANGAPVAVTLDEIAVLLTDQNDDDSYVYPVEITEVIHATTGAAVDAVDSDFSGWGAIVVAPWAFSESFTYTTPAENTQTARVYSGHQSVLAGGSAQAVVRVDTTLLSIGSIGSVALYADYTALRTDSSPLAQLDVHGRTPDLVRVRRQDIDQVVGLPSLRNPMRTILDEYFTTAGNKTVYFVGVGAIDANSPMGTEVALDDVWDLLLRRSGYHIAFVNPAPWVLPWAVEKADSLGGEVVQNLDGSYTSTPLAHTLFLYLPVSIPEVAPDKTIVEGSILQLISTGPSETLINTDVNHIVAGTLEGDYLVSSSFPLAGPVTISEGVTGWLIVAVDSANPTRLTVSEDPNPVIYSTPENPKPWYVVRAGQSLRTDSGRYDSDAALTALLDYHDREGYLSPLVQKHCVNSYSHIIQGVRSTLAGHYLLAQYMGIIARSLNHIPTSGARYSSLVESVLGADAYFTTAQMSQLAGVGLTLASQPTAPTGPTSVWRDVSSDTTTFTSTRRTARVSEHWLTRRMDNFLRPRLAQQLATQEFVDMLSAGANEVCTFFKDRNIFQMLEIVSLLPLDATTREQYGIDDTGLLVVWKYQHVEEVGVVVFHHIVSNN